jgi:acetoin utilization protein AcuB
MLMPTVARFMTRQPWTISRRATLPHAYQVMRDHAVRHLPVVDAGKLVGVLSERDIQRLAGFGSVTVEDAMSPQVYVVDREQSLGEVAQAMADHKYGSAIVVDPCGNVEGIFTTVDALDALVEVLRRAAQ